MANTPNPTKESNQHNHSPSNLTLALQWNLLGLRSRISELQLLISEYNPIALALQETMIPISKTYPNLIKNYDLYLCENPDNPQKTGSAIAVKNDIPHRNITFSSPLVAVAVEIEFPFKIILISLYISGEQQSNSNLKSLLTDLINQFPNSPVLLMGDFNGHSPLWGGSFKNPRGIIIEQFIDEHALSLLNDGTHTRIDPFSGKSSALDLSLSSHNLSPQLSWSVHGDCCGSDHLPIAISLNHALPVTSIRPRWLYESADWPNYQLDIIDSLKNRPPSSPDELVELVFDCAVKHIPRTKGIMGKKSVPWWNPEVRSVIKHRRKKLRALQRVAMEDRRNSEAHSAFKIARRAAKTAIMQAKQDSWNQFISSINPESSSKELWDKIHILNGNKSKQSIKLRIHNQITDNPSLISEHFADHFAQTSSSSNYSDQFLSHKTACESSPPNFDSDNTQDYNQDFSLAELEWALHRVRGSSAGPDNIGYPLFKNLPLFGKSFLLSLYNNIWHQGHIPTSWKEGLIIPIPKPDKNKHQADSFRPITLLNCISKIFEKMVNRRLMTLLDSQDLLDNRQFAFRPNKSTDDYLTELEHVITSNLDKGLHGDLVSLDLSKAYDRAWRFPILKSLEEWGIKGRMGLYVQSFLDDRRFRVGIGNCRSDERCQENGIPQGSVIAPTLFLICMQSLFENIPPNTHILVYADDITILTFHSFKSLTRKRIQSSVNIVSAWADKHGFTISPEKSQLLHISSNTKKLSKLPDLTLNNHIIKSQKSLKILGIFLDRTLSFRHHAETIRKTTVKRINVIQAIGTRIPSAHRRTLIQVVNSWLIPKMFYGVGFFSRCDDRIHQKLRPIYNKAFRYASGAFVTSPILSIMAECGQLPYDYLLTNSVVTKATRWLSLNRDPDVPLVQRAITLFQSLTNKSLPQTAVLSRPKIRPWNQPPPSVDLSLLQVVRAGDPPSKIQSHFLKLRNDMYANHRHLYTDGSVSNGKVGYGISVDSSLQNISSSLPPICSIFSAEAFALMQASNLDFHFNIPSVIFSDSASCLQELNSSCVQHPWLQEAERLSSENRIVFCWVPGHAGILGNEKADRLAGEGRELVPEDVPIPAQDITRWATEEIRHSWDLKWFNSRHLSLRRLKSHTFPWPDNINPLHRRAITRLRIGHTRLTHSYLINKEPPPNCSSCCIPLSIQHLLIDCPSFLDERLAANVSGTLEEVLAPPNEKSLIKFLNDTGIIDQI